MNQTAAMSDSAYQRRKLVDRLVTVACVVAMALAGLDTANLASYSDESTNEPVLTGLRDRVQVELVRACGALTQAEVVIETVDGSILRRRHDCGIPAAICSSIFAAAPARPGSALAAAYAG